MLAQQLFNFFSLYLHNCMMTPWEALYGAAAESAKTVLYLSGKVLDRPGHLRVEVGGVARSFT